MSSFLMANALQLPNDPFSVSFPSPTQLPTFFESFDSFTTPPYPWTIQPSLNTSCSGPSGSRAVLPTLGQIDGFSYQLASPLQTPISSFFEIEPDKTTYEKCYDEFMEIKLAVIQEIHSRGKRLSAISTPDTGVSNSICSSPPSSPPSSVSSTPSSSSSDASLACRTPEPGRTAEVDVIADGLFDVEDGNDGDYLLSVSDSCPIIRRRLFRTTQQSLKLKKTGEPKRKRKAMHTTEQSASKRQKCDIEVICRIRGCRHISKTRFECVKHRETHFPGRFQCPQPDCHKIFVRSSSLSRHLKRERSNACGIFAGPQAKWGVGLINFELFPPPWLAPGYLDTIESDS